MLENVHMENHDLLENKCSQWVWPQIFLLKYVFFIVLLLIWHKWETKNEEIGKSAGKLHAWIYHMDML